jgi:hypothetical protein
MERATPVGGPAGGGAPRTPTSRRELDDEVLSQEIRLLGDLVLAASSATQHLTDDEVDQLLGCPVTGDADDG